MENRNRDEVNGDGIIRSWEKPQRAEKRARPMCERGGNEESARGVERRQDNR
jgi:hypothetical protein